MVLLTPFQVQHKLEKSFGQNRNSMGNTRWLQKIGCTKTNSRNSIEAISSSDDCSAVLLCCTSYTSKSEEDCCTADQSMIFQFSSKQETNDFPGSWTRSTQAPIRRRAKLWKTDGDLAMNEWMIRTAATLLLPTRSLAVCPCLGLQSSVSQSDRNEMEWRRWRCELSLVVELWIGSYTTNVFGYLALVIAGKNIVKSCTRKTACYYHTYEGYQVLDILIWSIAKLF
jgi:hypothetical protein